MEAPETRITTFEYKSTSDAQNGLLDKVIDAAGREIQFAYDDAGRVTAQTFLADGRVVGFDYDDNGNLDHLDVPSDSAPAPRHAFAYTAVNLESAYTPPDSNWPGDEAVVPTMYLYNLTQDLTQIDRPDAGMVEFDYDDPRGRLDTVTLPDNETIEYSYFGSGADEGKLASVTTADAVLSFTYDGSLLTSEEWSGGVAGTVTHGYDDRFQTQSLQVNALLAVSFDYDRDGLLTAAGDLELTRDPETGFITATALPTSSPQVSDMTAYSAFAELASYSATYPGGGSYSYTIDSRDALGRITEKSETIGGVTTVYEYAYDVAGRLEEVTVDATVTATYHYDANGNRTAHDGVGGTPIATAEYDDQDRLREYGSATYEYTENGELLSKTVGSDTTTYTYDALGNLRQVTSPGGTPEIEYLVDGRNRRIGKKVNNVLVQKLLYQDQLEPIAEIDAAGNVSVFVYGSKAHAPDYMVRYNSAGTLLGTYRFLSDHLGSVRLVVDVATGTIAQRIDYDEFGVVTNDTNPSFQPFGFAGGIWDSDDPGATHAGSGLVRFGARDYDPAVGRWTAKDPYRVRAADTNLYAYVSADPIRFVDPEGKSKIEGIARGDDPWLHKIRDAAHGGRDAIRDVEAEVHAARRSGELHGKQWQKVKAWLKLAKRGDLRMLAPCLLSTVDCYCIQNPLDCADLMRDLARKIHKSER